MKKNRFVLYTLLLSLIINPVCNAEGMGPNDILKTAVSVTAVGSGIIMGGLYFIHNNIQHTELEKNRMLIQAEEQKKEKRKQQFNTIKRLEELAEKFKELHEKNPRAEAQPDTIQQAILQKMLLLEGSATKFEQTVTILTQASYELDPEIAQEHQESLKILSWLRQSIHINAHVSKKMSTERENRLAKEKEDAVVKTIKLQEKITSELEETARQNLANSKEAKNVAATAMSNMNQFDAKQRSYMNKLMEKLYVQLETYLSSTYNQITDLLATMESDNRSEHRKTRDEQYASEQRTAGKINNIEQQLVYMAQELASIKRLVLPTPSIPPAQAFPAGQNPPAQNPHWVPGVPPHVPQ